MKVAMMQPAFMPWQGFFALVNEADTFIFLDDFQFSIQSYHQRNKLLVNADTADWYTVPVKKKEAFKKPLNEVFPNNAQNWHVKIDKRLQGVYGKAPFFKEVHDAIVPLLRPEDSLADINMNIIKRIVSLMGWTKEYAYSSQIAAKGARTAKVISLVEAVGGSHYLSAMGAYGYMAEDDYPSMTDTPVSFLDYQVQPYPQHRTTDFISHLSVIDALFNIGPEATGELISRSANWLSWEAAKELHDA